MKWQDEDGERKSDKKTLKWNEQIVYIFLKSNVQCTFAEKRIIRFKIIIIIIMKERNIKEDSSNSEMHGIATTNQEIKMANNRETKRSQQFTIVQLWNRIETYRL